MRLRTKNSISWSMCSPSERWLQRFSITEFSILEYRPSVPDVNRCFVRGPDQFRAARRRRTRPFTGGGLRPRRPLPAPAAEHCSLARSCGSLRRPCPAATGPARRQAHFLRDQADDLEIRLRAHGADGALQPLHFAADVGHGAVLFVGATPRAARHRRACAVSVRNRSCTTTKAFVEPAALRLRADSRRPPTARPDLLRRQHLRPSRARA